MRQWISTLTNFYPRPPRGGRLRDELDSFVELVISIHALREEGDELIAAAADDKLVFLSTPSARRATVTLTSGSP